MQTEPEKGKEIGVILPYIDRIMIMIDRATKDSMDTGTLWNSKTLTRNAGFACA